MSPYLQRLKHILLPASGSEFSEDFLVFDEVSRAVAQSIIRAAKNKLPEEEKLLLDDIECLRNELRSSKEVIEFRDYGVGSSGDLRKRTIGNICRRSSKSARYARVLFALIRTAKPSLCVEMGSCLGISAAYQALALKLNGHGKLMTIEGADILSNLTEKHLDRLGLKEHVYVINLPFAEALPELKNNHYCIDHLFIDGHHDGQATLDYFKTLQPLLSDNAIVVFDDIFYSRGMMRAWRTLRSLGCWKLVTSSEQLGVCMYSKEPVKHKLMLRF